MLRTTPSSRIARTRASSCVGWAKARGSPYPRGQNLTRAVPTRRLPSKRFCPPYGLRALPLRRRPAVRLGAGAAHEHVAVAGAQAAGLEEGRDGLLVVDDRERARPVRAPQAALQTPGIEHARERIPDVREGIWLVRQRAGAADLDHHVRPLGEVEHLREIRPGLRRRRRHARLQDAEMVEDEARVGMAVDQRGAGVDVAPAQDVDGQVVAHGRAQDAAVARVVRRALLLMAQEDADADRARRLLPLGDDIRHRRIVRVDRLDDAELAGMRPLHLHGVARVVAIHGKGRDEDRAVDADLVHRRHHLVAGGVRGPVRHAVPGPLRRVRLIGMDLGIDDRHGLLHGLLRSRRRPLSGHDVLWVIISAYPGEVDTGSPNGICADAWRQRTAARPWIHNASRREPTMTTSSSRVSVFISGGFGGAYAALLPEFERTSGIAVTTGSGASQGSGPHTIGAQLARGVTADVVILSREGLAELIAAQRIAAATDVDLARVGLGVAVRAGAARPDVRSVDAFTQALLKAATIAVPASTSGIWLKTDLFPRLGVADKLDVRMTPRGSQAAAMVAAGGADLAVMPVSEILVAPGVDFAGALAAEIQMVQVFAAAVVAGSTVMAEARRLIAFLASPRASESIRRSGMEPMAGSAG